MSQTIKSFSQLVSTTLYQEAKEKARVQRVVAVKTEVYLPRDARIPVVREQGPIMAPLRMKDKRPVKVTPIQQALKKYELAQASKDLWEKNYRMWAEAKLNKREVEALKQANEACVGIMNELTEALYVAQVGHGRVVRFNLGKTWVEELYAKKA